MRRSRVRLYPRARRTEPVLAIVAGNEVDRGGLFSGSAVGAVSDGGRVQLPRFVRRAIARRSDSPRLIFAAHDNDPCLIGFDSGHSPVVHAELERRRLLDEAAGIGSDRHHARARRRFGFAGEGRCDERGMVAIPALMRRRAGIETLALFVGIGGEFEVWDPQAACRAGGDDLRELAEYWLGQEIGKDEGETDE